MLVTGSKTSWTAIRAPQPAHAMVQVGVSINSVACTSPSHCVATGSYTDTSGGNQGLLLIGSGRSWRVIKPPLPSGMATAPTGGQNADISDITCPSVFACVAIGQYTDAAAGEQGMMLTGSNSTWTAVRAPTPPGADAPYGTMLGSVACPAPSECVITGSYIDSYEYAHAMLVTGSRSGWAATRPPLPPGADAAYPSSIGDVACASATSCVATGVYTDRHDYEHWMIVTGSGTSWSSSEVPMPTGVKAVKATAQPVGGFGAVACTTASVCVITGSYTDSSGNDQALLAILRRGPAAAGLAPQPASRTANSDEHVSWQAGDTGLTEQDRRSIASALIAARKAGEPALSADGYGGVPQLTITAVQRIGTWATFSVVMRIGPAAADLAAEPVFFIGRRTGLTWSLTFPGSAQFCTRLHQLPMRLHDPADNQYFGC